MPSGDRLRCRFTICSWEILAGQNVHFALPIPQLLWQLPYLPIYVPRPWIPVIKLTTKTFATRHLNTSITWPTETWRAVPQQLFYQSNNDETVHTKLKRWKFSNFPTLATRILLSPRRHAVCKRIRILIRPHNISEIFTKVKKIKSNRSRI